MRQARGAAGGAIPRNEHLRGQSSGLVRTASALNTIVEARVSINPGRPRGPTRHSTIESQEFEDVLGALPGGPANLLHARKDSKDAYVFDPAWRQKMGQRVMNQAKHITYMKRGWTSSMANEGEFRRGLTDPWRKSGKSLAFLVLLGVTTGLLSHGIDKTISYMLEARDRFTEGDHLSWGLQLLLFWAYCVLGTTLASVLTAHFMPMASGSGIPMMKYMLGTDDIAAKARARFTKTAGIIKVVGLLLASGTGLNIGREGPFVHIAGMIAFQIADQVPYFHEIAYEEPILRQAFAAACAVGVASTFGATVGGVLFAIEVTSTYYLVANYFKGFVAAIAGAMARTLIDWPFEGMRSSKETPIMSTFTHASYSFLEFPLFMLLGLLFGALGPLYVRQRLWVLKLFRQWGKWDRQHDPKRRREFLTASVCLGAAVATVTALLSFLPGEYNRLGPFQIFSELLEEDLGSRWVNVTGGRWTSLAVCFCTRWFMALVGTSIVVPAGDFIQTAVVGGCMGRIVGEAMALVFPGINPATYAILCGAAFAAGATQTISVAVVILEFTGAFALELPMLLITVCSFSLSRRLGLNLYDSVMRVNGLDWLPGLNTDNASALTAKDIMERDVRCVTTVTTPEAILELLENRERKFASFPVISNTEERAFLGTVHRRDLASALDRLGDSNEEYRTQIRPRIRGDLRDQPSMHYDRRQQLLNTLGKIRDTALTIGKTWGRTETDNGSSRGRSPVRPRSSPFRMRRRSADPGTQGEQGRPPDEPSPPRLGAKRMTLMDLERGAWSPERVEQGLLETFLHQPINLIALAQNYDILIDPSAWAVPENMEMPHVHALFELLRVTRLFVVSGGELRGVISRALLFKALIEKQGNKVE